MIGKGRGGPSNFTDEGLHPFLVSVEDAVKDALDSVRRHFAESHVEWQWGSVAASAVVSTVASPPNGSSSSSATPPPLAGRAQRRLGEEDDALETRSRVAIPEALHTLRPPTFPASHTPSATFQAAWFGIAGVDSPGDVTTLSPHLASLLSLPFPSSRLIVANDTSLLASPITDSSRPEIRSGVVAIAGTGSIVMSFKRSRSGMLKVLGRVGGFGWLLGDEGSGYSVGRAAVRRVLDLADRERLATERGDDDDSDSDEERGSPLAVHSDTDMEVPGRMSRDFASIDSAKETEGKQTSITQQQHQQQLPCGQLLRDRILQDWGLLSTDELLRAVYFDDAPSASSSTFDGVPSIMRSVADSHTMSDSTLRVRMSTNPCRSQVPFAREQPSISLLPPNGPKIDEEARLRRPSPIPSLSSSPSDCGMTAVLPNGRDHRRWPSQVDSSATTEASSVASSLTSQDPSHPRATSERKHRLASLTPLVFHLAFTHGDQLCLEILRSQAHFIALQIRDILQPHSLAKAHLSSYDSVLCLGGGLVGQARYRCLLVDELRKLGVVFAAVEYVGDPATRGAIALSSVVEQRAGAA